MRHLFPKLRLCPILKASALVFVRLAHDRRFVGAVLFLFVLVLFVLIRISWRHRVAHDHERTRVDQLGGKFLGDVWGHVVAPRVWTLGDFTPSAPISHEGYIGRYRCKSRKSNETKISRMLIIRPFCRCGAL